METEEGISHLLPANRISEGASGQCMLINVKIRRDMHVLVALFEIGFIVIWLALIFSCIGILSHNL